MALRLLLKRHTLTRPLWAQTSFSAAHATSKRFISKSMTGFEEEVYVNPPMKLLLGIFASSFIVSYIHCSFYVAHFDIDPDRSFAAIDRSIERTLAGSDKDYLAAITTGIESDLKELDWAVIGTHLMKAVQPDYAFNSFYMAYLLSEGRVSTYRDWAHQSLLEGDSLALEES